MNEQIANPIYDVVFKYLMEDNAVAKLKANNPDDIMRFRRYIGEQCKESIQIYCVFFLGGNMDEGNDAIIEVEVMSRNAKDKINSGINT